MATTTITFSANEIAERGKTWYEQRLREEMEESHFGHYLVIDVVTGEYEVNPDHLEATQRARAKNPDAALFGMRIDYPATAAIGAKFRPLKDKNAGPSENTRTVTKLSCR